MLRLPVSKLLRATAWMAISAVTFAASSAAAKFLGQKLPPAELAFFRSAFGLLFLFGTWRAVVEIRNARDPIWYVVRCGLGVLALCCMMYAFTSIPLGLASLIFFMRVFMLPIASQLMLGERANGIVWSTIVVGFTGAVVSLVPALGVPEMHLGILAAFAGAVASAGSQTAVRRLTKSNNPALIVLVYTAVSTLATAPLAAPSWLTPLPSDWLILSILGLFAMIAQYAAARSYALAPVPFLAPLDFLTVPCAALLGFVVFGEVPDFYTLIGAALILFAALGVTASERQHALGTSRVAPSR
ncbi:DMT family transporter [Azospirillum sp. SYSU D00513]|uniref:DMT family transporter n=1 Tax=Azospirillum sp. SYSU D00513 TaxID=2812561 RepID=UPI001A95C9D3|nr:DMT family transporter [Azospirillum sp. SYSU D00513]